MLPYGSSDSVHPLGFLVVFLPHATTDMINTQQLKRLHQVRSVQLGKLPAFPFVSYTGERSCQY